MNTETNFFQNQNTDANSTSYLWLYNTMNIIIEGTWDSASIILQVKYATEWIDFLTFTQNGFAIIDNLLPGVYIRFQLVDAGASTDLTCNVIKK